jgi:hypothetical protein
MQALKDKRVQLSIVGLVVAAAAAYGVAVDEQALLAVVALLAGAAGGVVGRIAGGVEDKAQPAAPKLEDEIQIVSDLVNRSLAEPTLYTDTIANADRIYDLSEMAEDIGILNQRITALEALIERQQADS